MTIFNFGFQEDLYEIKGKTFKIKPHYIDLILSFVAMKMITKELQYGYVDIPSIELKKTYDKYWIYTDYLKAKHVIEVRPHSDKHKRCKGFRFNYLFLENIEIQGIVLNSVNQKKRISEEIQLADQAVIPFTIIQRLKKDFEKIEVNLDKIEKVRYEDSPYVDAPKFFRSLIQLEKLRQKGNLIKFEFTANRLYTSFSFISGFYRTKNILLNNETLVEFDLSSSFPLMFAIHALKVNPKIVNDYDFKEYCTQLKTGNFYTNLTFKLNENINIDSKKLKKDKDGLPIANRKLSRNDTKELFQKLLNSKKNRNSYIKGFSNPHINKIFEQKFECLSEVLDEIKMKNEKVYYKLSKLETEFIFSVVAEIYDKLEGVSVLTLHDAIYVPLSFSEHVSEIWKENICKLYDLLPDTFSKASDKILEVAGIYMENNYSQSKVKGRTTYGSKYNEMYWEFLDEDDF